ncbi:MAG: hypothetical protein GTO40_19335, partial [Deltaproteobacteria bacterium]|nr:hypothetical protein [Deltaproteobacteria bacterium]
IVQRGCNIEDSKMAVFCGEFALIVLITGGSGNLARINKQYEELAKQTGLNITVKRPVGQKPKVPALPYRLTASLMDHPGVVHKLSGLLSGLSINIESMETKTHAAPVSGTPIFRLEAHLEVPTTVNINDLKARFAEVEREENIDIELSLITN